MADFDPAAWAQAEATRLHGLAREHPGGTQVWRNWSAEGAATVEFLHAHARGTALHSSAMRIMDEGGYLSDTATQLARLLEQWISATEVGLLQAAPFSVRARVEAATDLMEQVEILLADRQVHPAAPIMLAGAALEELLRSLWDRAGSPTLAGKPGMNSYADALAKAQVLDRQDVKDVTSMAGRRNDAAHGDFDKVNDPAIARLMVDQVNLFLQRHTPR